jgi:glycerol-3-phosphate dehydrogenase
LVRSTSVWYVRCIAIVIERNPGRYSQRKYDLIIVGGGIYGAMLAVQATARQLRPLLVERDDFGGHTSFNSLRIIHGGLRYLQSFDLPRLFESVRERRWFLSEFADFARPLPCLMPLYGRGLKRSSILRLALIMNDALSGARNAGVPEDNRLPRGRVVDRREARRLFPLVATDGLQGAALWYDAAIEDSPRVMMELLHWAADYGADLLNYVEADGLITASGQVSGLSVVDRATGDRHVFNAPVVINATGPWSEKTAAALGADSGELFRPSLAWNLWMDDAALSDCGLAITPERDGAPTYFLHPWKGRLLIGTGHASWQGSPDRPLPARDQIQSMLDDINMAIPGLNLVPERIRRVFAGLLPARRLGSAELSVRPHFGEHVKTGGPRGFFSVFGVKFTTSRHVALYALNKIFGKHHGTAAGFRRPPARSGWCLRDINLNDPRAMDGAVAGLQQLIAEESVVHLSDLVVRRTDLWENPSVAHALVPNICDLFSWDERQRSLEIDQLARALDRVDR